MSGCCGDGKIKKPKETKKVKVDQSAENKTTFLTSLKKLFVGS